MGTEVVVVAVLAWMTTLARVALGGIHLYAAVVCASRDKILSHCNETDVFLMAEGRYDRVQIASYIVETTTLAGFAIVVLCFWKPITCTLLVCGKRAVWRKSVFYTLIGLCMTEILLIWFGTMVTTTLTGDLGRAWKALYGLELIAYFMVAVVLANLGSDAMSDAISAHTQSPGQRKLLVVTWVCFLLLGALHNIGFAGYDAMELSSTLHRHATHLRPTVLDSIFIIVAITTHTLLARRFYRRCFDAGLCELLCKCTCCSRHDNETDTEGGNSPSHPPGVLEIREEPPTQPGTPREMRNQAVTPSDAPQPQIVRNPLAEDSFDEDKDIPDTKMIRCHSDRAACK